MRTVYCPRCEVAFDTTARRQPTCNQCEMTVGLLRNSWVIDEDVDHDAHVQAWAVRGVSDEWVNEIDELDLDSECWQDDWEGDVIMWSWTTLRGYNQALKTRSIDVMTDESIFNLITICLTCGVNAHYCVC